MVENFSSFRTFQNKFVCRRWGMRERKLRCHQVGGCVVVCVKWRESDGKASISRTGGWWNSFESFESRSWWGSNRASRRQSRTERLHLPSVHFGRSCESVVQSLFFLCAPKWKAIVRWKFAALEGVPFTQDTGYALRTHIYVKAFGDGEDGAARGVHRCSCFVDWKWQSMNYIFDTQHHPVWKECQIENSVC